jgi:hypothetical protein
MFKASQERSDERRTTSESLKRKLATYLAIGAAALGFGYAIDKSIEGNEKVNRQTVENFYKNTGPNNAYEQFKQEIALKESAKSDN